MSTKLQDIMLSIMTENRSWGVFVGLGALALTVPFMTLKVFSTLNNIKKRKALKDKVVVITGASSGIGEALAHVFYKQGCRVVLCARRVDELERVRFELLQQQVTIPTQPPIVIPLDLNDLGSFERIVRDIIDVTGQIDYLINNGGITSRGSVVETNMDVFVKVMTVNYFGTVAFTKAVLPHMMKRTQGHIVLMSSLQGLISIPRRAPYGASKHAMQAFADSLRAEVAASNILVTVISPGYVKTDISLNALNNLGNRRGQMDTNSINGYSADYAAKKTCTAIVQGKEEVKIAPFPYHLLVWIRANISSLYFYIMKKKMEYSKDEV